MQSNFWAGSKNLDRHKTLLRPVEGQGTKVKEVLGKDILNPVLIQVLKTSLVLGPFKNNVVNKGW